MSTWSVFKFDLNQHQSFHADVNSKLLLHSVVDTPRQNEREHGRKITNDPEWKIIRRTQRARTFRKPSENPEPILQLTSPCRTDSNAMSTVKPTRAPAYVQNPGYDLGFGCEQRDERRRKLLRNRPLCLSRVEEVEEGQDDLWDLTIQNFIARLGTTTSLRELDCDKLTGNFQTSTTTLQKPTMQRQTVLP